MIGKSEVKTKKQDVIGKLEKKSKKKKKKKS